MTEPPRVQETFGSIDIYLFDQLQKGRIEGGMSVLDAGCGAGRNLVYLARMGCDLTAMDKDLTALEMARANLEAVGGKGSRYLLGVAEALPFDNTSFHVVLSSAVLHFARDHRHFSQMVRELWRVLMPGGLFFARLASQNGIEGRLVDLGDGRYGIPDGSERYLVNANDLADLTKALGGTLLDPVKTTNVQDLRCMTTWVAQKH